jgi:Mn2+/Fe2+ NRAMP family transporter
MLLLELLALTGIGYLIGGSDGALVGFGAGVIFGVFILCFGWSIGWMLGWLDRHFGPF